MIMCLMVVPLLKSYHPTCRCRNFTETSSPRAMIKGLNTGPNSCKPADYLVDHPTNRKWVISPVINGISRVNPLVTGDLLPTYDSWDDPPSSGSEVVSCPMGITNPSDSSCSTYVLDFYRARIPEPPPSCPRKCDHVLDEHFCWSCGYNNVG